MFKLTQTILDNFDLVHELLCSSLSSDKCMELLMPKQLIICQEHWQREMKTNPFGAIMTVQDGARLPNS